MAVRLTAGRRWEAHEPEAQMREAWTRAEERQAQAQRRERARWGGPTGCHHLGSSNSCGHRAPWPLSSHSAEVGAPVQEDPPGESTPFSWSRCDSSRSSRREPWRPSTQQAAARRPQAPLPQAPLLAMARGRRQASAGWPWPRLRPQRAPSFSWLRMQLRIVPCRCTRPWSSASTCPAPPQQTPPPAKRPLQPRFHPLSCPCPRSRRAGTNNPDCAGLADCRSPA